MSYLCNLYQSGFVVGFLSHQEFLQCQLNQTDILYETLGPMQYSVDEQKVGVFDF